MPRFARLHAPGALVHVIARFHNGELRLATPADRAIVLACLPRALARTDWTLHAYALMGNHIHLVMTAGEAPPGRFLKSLLVAAAHRLNRAHRRSGHVFGDRASTILVPPARAARLLAYVHNNPVRARAASDAASSDWTSHRAFVGVDPAPPWLAVGAGLALAGFDDTPPGRAAFDAFVRASAQDARDPAASDEAVGPMRARTRAAMALPVELSSPVGDERDAVTAAVIHHGPLRVLPRWGGDLDELVRAAAQACGCAIEEVRSRTHRPAAVTARRIVMVVGLWLLRRQVNELAAALTIANSSASRLLRRGAEVLTRAREIARLVRERDARAGATAGVSA